MEGREREARGSKVVTAVQNPTQPFLCVSFLFHLKINGGNLKC